MWCARLVTSLTICVHALDSLNMCSPWLHILWPGPPHRSLPTTHIGYDVAACSHTLLRCVHGVQHCVLINPFTLPFTLRCYYSSYLLLSAKELLLSRVDHTHLRLPVGSVLGLNRTTPNPPLGQIPQPRCGLMSARRTSITLDATAAQDPLNRMG